MSPRSELRFRSVLPARCPRTAIVARHRPLPHFAEEHSTHLFRELQQRLGGKASTLTLTQSGNAFTGSASGDHCVGTFEDVMILNGSVFGDSVSFDIQLPNTYPISFLETHNSGTISGDSMNGAVTVLVSVCGITGCDEFTLSGHWSAVR